MKCRTAWRMTKIGAEGCRTFGRNRFDFSFGLNGSKVLRPSQDQPFQSPMPPAIAYPTYRARTQNKKDRTFAGKAPFLPIPRGAVQEDLPHFFHRSDQHSITRSLIEPALGEQDRLLKSAFEVGDARAKGRGGRAVRRYMRRPPMNRMGEIGWQRVEVAAIEDAIEESEPSSWGTESGRDDQSDSFVGDAFAFGRRAGPGVLAPRRQPCARIGRLGACGGLPPHR